MDEDRENWAELVDWVDWVDWVELVGLAVEVDGV